MDRFDAIIIGAGAAGLMCARTAGERGLKVLVIDHNLACGKKIDVSGGGRSNFTNLDIRPEHYVSRNPHFARSALARFGARDILAIFDEHKLAYYEKTNEQMFCKGAARLVTGMLVKDCIKADVQFKLGCKIKTLSKNDIFRVETSSRNFCSRSLVIATGGLSYQSLGATDLGYRTAKKFGLDIIEPYPALVPLLFSDADKRRFGKLSGISAEASVSCTGKKFSGSLLFTHNGLSGPVILNASLAWKGGETLTIDLLPNEDLRHILIKEKKLLGKKLIKNIMAAYLPKNLIDAFDLNRSLSEPILSSSDAKISRTVERFCAWTVRPAGTAGYPKAEVTGGGVDTDELSSKTFESKKIAGLYFIGEVLDVTGMIGGYNLHWAFASGHAAGASL